MIDQLLFHWANTFLGTPIVRGRCLNIGLGAGASARLMLALRHVDSVHSIELDPKLIDAYRATFNDDLEQYHEIFEQDVLKMTNWKNLYDFVLLDAEFDSAACLTVMQNIGAVLDSGGAVVAEWLPRETVMSSWTSKKETNPDAVFWDYMNANWQLVETWPSVSPVGDPKPAVMRYLIKAQP